MPTKKEWINQAEQYECKAEWAEGSYKDYCEAAAKACREAACDALDDNDA